MKGIIATRITTIGSFLIACGWSYQAPDWEPISVLFLASCALIAAECKFYDARKRNKYSLFPKSSGIQANLDQHFQGSSHDITLIGIHFEKSISDHRGSYEEALKRGVRIKIFCISPESKELPELSNTLRINAEELRQECLTFRQQVISLTDFAQSNSVKGAVEYFNCERPYLYRAYVFDAQHSNGRLLYIPLIDGIRSSASPALELCTKGKYSDAIMESIRQIERDSMIPCMSSLIKPQAAASETTVCGHVPS